MRLQVLTEAGFRCAVPTYRGILALDLHHLDEVHQGGGDDPSNLLALCPTCHALYHRGTIPPGALYTYKSILVSLSSAFDMPTVDLLLFLAGMPRDNLIVSGDGLLTFARLIAAGYAEARMANNNNFLLVTYAVHIAPKGKLLIDAWRTGNREAVREALTRPGIDGA